MFDIENCCIPTSAKVAEAINSMERTGTGIALIVDGSGCLVGTITDGDVRRGLLRNSALDSPVTDIMSYDPISVSRIESQQEIRQLMHNKQVRQIPVVDDSGRPLNLHRLENIASQEELADQKLHRPIAVVMAGGEGRRLRPITDKIPKPMVMVDDVPILEGVVRSIVASGIDRIYIAVNYLADAIESYFGKGEQFGATIEYLREKQPLGTAGALSLLPQPPTGPILVMNGDIITSSNFSNMFNYHQRLHNVATVATVEYTVKVPYGVLNVTNNRVMGIEEKPDVRLPCNAGIYVLEPDVLNYCPNDRAFHMTDLIASLIETGLPVGAFPMYEKWAAIDRLEDLVAARHSKKTTN